MKQRIVVGISGASGVIYGVRALEMLREAGVESHLVLTRSAALTIGHELDLKLDEVKALADVVHPAGEGVERGHGEALRLREQPDAVAEVAGLERGDRLAVPVGRHDRRGRQR